MVPIRFLLALVLMILSGAISCVAAANPLSESQKKRLSEATLLVKNDKNDSAMVIFDSLVRETEIPSEARGAVQLRRGWALHNQGKYADAAVAGEEARTMGPSDAEPDALELLAFSYSNGRQARQAATALVRLTEYGRSFMNLIPPKLVRQIRRQLADVNEKDIGFDFDYALLQSGYNGGPHPDSWDWVAIDTISTLIEQSRLSEARSFLPRIHHPKRVFEMLADRSFEPLWPELEKIGGPHLEAMAERYIVATRSAWKQDPSNVALHTDHLDALNFLNRFETILEESTKYDDPTNALKTQGQKVVWAVQARKTALLNLNRADDAMVLFARLNSHDIKTYPELISTIINETLELATIGEPNEALAKIATARKLGGSSEYGRMFLARAEVCALQRANRSAEARDAFEALVTNRASNKMAHLEALVCLGSLLEIEPAVIALLQDKDLRRSILGFLQRPGTSGRVLEYGDSERAVIELLRKRPAVIAELNKVGRFVPDEFIPR